MDRIIQKKIKLNEIMKMISPQQMVVFTVVNGSGDTEYQVAGNQIEVIGASYSEYIVEGIGAEEDVLMIILSEY